MTLPRALALPDFPWDSLVPARALAAAAEGGVCDLSVGTPVDPTPPEVREALAGAADAPGYPTVIGTVDVRRAILEWAARRGMVDVGLDGAIPTIGSKEAVALLPMLLGVRPGDIVLVPRVAYPTYDVGARLAGATPVPVDPADTSSWPEEAALVWVNSPGNPDGHVLSVEELRAIVSWARARGAVVVSDECYAALAWEEPWVSEGVPSLLDPRVCEGDASGLLVLYSLSKQSNLAGYRAALMVGDPELVRPVVQVRKHAGLMVPAPVQAAMAVALRDEDHVRRQVEVYGERRRILAPALRAVGLEIDPASVAGLYLWVRVPEGWRLAEGERLDEQARAVRADLPDGESWDLVHAFAARGIVVAPGDFYGEAARGWVRIALTASTERIRAAADRMSGMSLERWS